MTDRNQAKEHDTDWGQIGLIALVALALIASVIMLLTDSAAALKLALLAALWAAVIGVFLGGRYRNQARAAEQEMAHREEALRAEIASIQEKAEAQAKAPEIDPQILEDIRKEIAVVRAQLEELSGRAFEFEPAALRAEARRIMELEAQTMKATRPAAEVPIVVPEPEEDLEADRPTPTVSADYSGVPSAAAVSGRIGSVPSRDVPNPLTEIINQKKREEAQAEQPTAPAQPETGKSESPEPVTPTAPEVDEEDSGRGRRRRDEHVGGVSVAELLARAKKGS
ncbi:DUF6779 domain-containing protein [Corynebacterium guangdongense]|uniref:DUF6779 domain-containing protein n=1 Tax=Corynebacterium guangdongense TaxID=1783348 RepID=A0ABU1ZZD8_9CORY|nr:DUF6779 domain-containing protein [Corynebacterium guangdongense]MDR7330304.1 hypothetical protein [Corynebacterium guangdongense]WJZ18862.1 hypothetical protein CGUA_11630 [Corynebacterium guangdongense]